MSQDGTERTVVKTYVPAYQRDTWDEHADRLDMSRAEFVRSMVQAGRRGFGSDSDSDKPAETSEASQAEGGSDEPTPESHDTLETQIVGMLSEGPRDWDELLGALTADIEGRLDETLQELQDEGRVRYSGPDGGYVLE